jgi:hypothetical protein
MIAILLLPLIGLVGVGAFRFFAGSLRGRDNIPGNHTLSQRRLRLTGTIVLVTGLLGAGVIYVETAPPETNSGLGYATTGPFSTTYAPGETKRSEAQNEIIQGKGGMLFTDIREWVNSLWHGRKLASTVAVLSVVTFLVCLFLAHPLLAQADPADERKEDGKA